MNRIEQLREFIQTNPQDPFPRYGLALEHKNQGQLDDARRVFAELLESFPDYTAAYLHFGGVLVGLGRKDEAAAIYRKGVEACERKRDFHAKGELEAAIADLGLNV